MIQYVATFSIFLRGAIVLKWSCLIPTHWIVLIFALFQMKLNIEFNFSFFHHWSCILLTNNINSYFAKLDLGCNILQLVCRCTRCKTQDFNHLHLDLKILLLYQDLPWLLSYIHYNKPWIVEKNLLLGLLLTNTFILILYWRLIFLKIDAAYYEAKF